MLSTRPSGRGSTSEFKRAESSTGTPARAGTRPGAPAWGRHFSSAGQAGSPNAQSGAGRHRQHPRTGTIARRIPQRDKHHGSAAADDPDSGSGAETVNVD